MKATYHYTLISCGDKSIMLVNPTPEDLERCLDIMKANAGRHIVNVHHYTGGAQ